jgi:hypothetical protein
MIRIMIRTMFALLGLIALAAPAGAAERRYPVTDFDRIVVEGAYVVRVAIGRTTTASASGSQDALDRVSIDVSGTTLRIRRNTQWVGTSGAQQGVITVALSTRNLRSVRLVGPANFEVDGIRGQRVDLTVEGSGRLRAVNIAADTLELGLRGAGRLELAGRAGVLRADVQGTGELAASGLTADNATLMTTTMGNVSLAARTSATVTANGLGEVVITGRPACTVRGQGAGQVRCGANAAAASN